MALVVLTFYVEEVRSDEVVVVLMFGEGRRAKGRARSLGPCAGDVYGYSVGEKVATRWRRESETCG